METPEQCVKSVKVTIIRVVLVSLIANLWTHFKYIVLLISLLTFNKEMSTETSKKPWVVGVLQQSISGALSIKILWYDLILIFPITDITKCLEGKHLGDHVQIFCKDTTPQIIEAATRSAL